MGRQSQRQHHDYEARPWGSLRGIRILAFNEETDSRFANLLAIAMGWWLWITDFASGQPQTVQV